MHEDLIFHLITEKQWKKHQKAGRYHPEDVDAEGFIQCFSKDVVQKEANENFNGSHRLLIIVIDTATVQPPIKYADPQDKNYPQIEGPLNLDAVLDRIRLVAEKDGSFEIDIAD